MVRPLPGLLRCPPLRLTPRCVFGGAAPLLPLPPHPLLCSRRRAACLGRRSRLGGFGRVVRLPLRDRTPSGSEAFSTTGGGSSPPRLRHCFVGGSVSVALGVEALYRSGCRPVRGLQTLEVCKLNEMPSRLSGCLCRPGRGARHACSRANTSAHPRSANQPVGAVDVQMRPAQRKQGGAVKRCDQQRRKMTWRSEANETTNTSAIRARASCSLRRTAELEVAA